MTVTFLSEGYEFRGTSAGSSTVLDETNGVISSPISGPQKLLYKTKATISLVALPSTLLQNTGVAAMRFSVAADSAGAFSFQAMQFTMTNGTVAGSAVCDTGSSVRKLNQSNIAGTCDDVGDTDFADGGYVEFAQEQSIAAGSTTTYELRLIFTGTAPDDSVSTLLEAVDFVWSDKSSVTHDSVGMTGDDWFVGGAYLDGLPTDPQTLSR